MDQLCREVLNEQRQLIVASADPQDVLLRHLIDHLVSKKCLNSSQEECIMRINHLSSSRMTSLLQFLCLGGATAFDELCKALEEFRNVGTDSLASSLRQKLKDKQHHAAHCLGK